MFGLIPPTQQRAFSSRPDHLRQLHYDFNTMAGQIPDNGDEQLQQWQRSRVLHPDIHHSNSDDRGCNTTVTVFMASDVHSDPPLNSVQAALSRMSLDRIQLESIQPFLTPAQDVPTRCGVLFIVIQCTSSTSNALTTLLLD